MQKIINNTAGIRKQLIRYLVVGISAVTADFISYSIFLMFLPYTPAKTLSFIIGTSVAYTFNKYWTFEQPHKDFSEIVRFSSLYISTLGANVFVNHLVLDNYPNLILFAFLAATGTSTILNFIGQKWWVFTKKQP